MTNRWLLARSGFALVLANLRYWNSVAPLVRTQLARWEQRALAIEDPALRALALGKLRDERFNVQVAATLATAAPRAHRERATEAIVAMQVIYDYLDALTEQPTTEPLIDGHLLFAAMSDAVSPGRKDDPESDTQHTRNYYSHRRSDDGGYLRELVATIRAALAQLPATGAIAEVAQEGAARCAQAQILNHQAPGSGIDEVQRWATVQASGTGLQWQEFLVGATASVLTIHALIAAAADVETTPEGARELDATYLSIGALTVLDSIIDYEHDLNSGHPGFLQYYEDPGPLASRLADISRDTLARARGLPNATHHIMTLTGVVAYYTSAPTANTELARPLIAPVHRALQPLITPTLALMRAWRLAKRLKRWRKPRSETSRHIPRGAPT
jgi:tetraprenyl-beta-curcumene synthase